MALWSRPALSGLKSILPPVFLCPVVGNLPPCLSHAKQCDIKAPRPQYKNAALVPSRGHLFASSSAFLPLPLQCPGCGAFAQSTNPEHAGYYNTSRKYVKTYLALRKASKHQECQSETETFDKVLKNINESLLKRSGFDGVPAVNDRK